MSMEEMLVSGAINADMSAQQIAMLTAQLAEARMAASQSAILQVRLDKATTRLAECEAELTTCKAELAACVRPDTAIREATLQGRLEGEATARQACMDMMASLAARVSALEAEERAEHAPGGPEDMSGYRVEVIRDGANLMRGFHFKKE